MGEDSELRYTNCNITAIILSFVVVSRIPVWVYILLGITLIYLSLCELERRERWGGGEREREIQYAFE